MVSIAPESVFDVESFINEYYDAWAGTDIDLIMSFYPEDVVLQTPGAFMEGREAVREQFVRPFTTAFPGNRHVVKNIISGPGVVNVEFSFEAKHRGPFAGHAPTGARINLPGCGVYEYDSAKRQITSGRIYFDVGTLLQTITELPALDPQKAAEALHLNEHNLSVIINTIPTTAWTTRADGYCDFLNQRWLDYAGMTAEQAEGWGWAAAIHPEDREGLIEYWTLCLTSGVAVEAEARIRRFDSAYRWFLFRASPVRDDSGKIVKWYGTNIDIEDRKRVEEGLRATELSWRQIVDNIPGLVATTGAMGEVEFLNRQTLEYFGRTSEELKDWALIDAVHPDDLPRVIEARKESIEAGEIYDIEHRCRRVDGVYRWFQVRGLPVRSADGAISSWYLLLTDIDDLKKAEEALQASERNLSLTINTIPTFISVSRADGTVLTVNQAALDYHGITLQDVQRGDHRTRFFHPDDVERVREVCKEALKHPRPFEYELRAMGKDGVYRWFSVRHNPLLDDQGRIERWYAIAFDIEDRKGTEEALRKSERQFRLLVETIPALVWRSTPEGDLDYLNRRAVEYLGHTAESLAGGRWLELVHPDHRDATLQRWLQSATTGTAYKDEYQLRRADGQYRWIQSVGEPFLDTEDRIANWFGLVFDIEDRKRAEAALRSAERNLNQIINTIPTHIYVLNTEGSVQYVNQAVMDYTGLSLEDAKQEDYRDRVIHPEDFESVRAGRAASLRLGAPFSTEQRVLGTDGQYRWFLVRYKPLLDEQGQIVRWYVAAFDIEDQKQAEAELQKSEARHRQVIDAIPALAWCNLPDGPNEFLSKPWHDYTGLTPAESEGWGWQTAFHPDDLPPLMEKWLKMLTSGEPDEVEARLRRHDGVYHWFLIRAEPFRDESGKIVRWYGTSTDIDDRKRAEQALQSSERNLRQVIDTIPTLIHVLGPDGSVLYVNPRVLDYTGLTLEDVQRGDYRARVGHPEDAEESLREQRAQALSSAVPFESEYRVLGKDGQYRWFLSRYNPLLDDQGKIDRWYVTATDIDDRKRAEAEVERAYVLLAEAQRLSRTGSFSWRVETDEITWSEEVYRIFQFQPGTPVTLELIGSRVHPEDQGKLNDLVEALRKAVSDVEYEHRLLMPDGSLKYLHLKGHGLRDNAGRMEYIGAVQDVTETKVAEEALTRARSELAHMARVTTLSALTASIAHEINQPISAAITSAGACLRWLNRDQPEVQRAREAAMRIEEDGRRAAEIITNLKSFYKKDVSPQRETVSVNDVVGEMLVLLRSEADRHSVVMRTELATDLPSGRADRVQLQQVLMNLMLNGIEAMSERGGELKIRTGREGEEVMVSVSDTGEGIPADKLEEIFNAFVTTKAEGTGMGLAISQTIIESHGGRLWATGDPGRGATFHFTLPTETEVLSDH